MGSNDAVYVAGVDINATNLIHFSGWQLFLKMTWSILNLEHIISVSQNSSLT